MEPTWPTPVVEHYLFESVWVLPLLLAIVGAIVFLVGRQRAEVGWLYGALGVWAAAIGAAVLSMAVTTDREELMARTIALADTAVSPWDVEEMRGFLSREFRYDDMRKVDIDRVVEHVSRVFEVQGYTTWRLMAHSPQEGFGQTYFSCWVDLRSRDYGSTRIPTHWLLDWRLEDGVWRVVEVREGMIYDRPASEELERYVP